MCTNGILPGATENSDGGGFNGIFLRWVARTMRGFIAEGGYQSRQRTNGVPNSIDSPILRMT
jgi:predicted alpha-1,6-mannanase (GH76 family)